MNAIVRTSLFGFLVLPLAAQSTGISAGGAIINGLEVSESLKKVTNNATGISINAAYDIVIPGSEVPARISLAFVNIPGKATTYSTPTTDGSLRTTLNIFQLSGDLLIATPAEGLKGIVGASLNKYSLDLEGNEDKTAANAGNPSAHFPVVDASGVKVGFRLGLDYTFTKRLSGEVLFQQTELSGHQRNDTLVRRGGLNPAWFQFGIRYHF